MEQNKQYDLIRSFFCEKLNCEGEELTVDTDLTLYEGYNSMLIVELILYIEENLNIEIPDEFFGLENYKSIGSILDILNNSIAAS